MGLGQGSRVAKGSRCDAKQVYHQENNRQGIPKICLNNGVELHLVGRQLCSYLLPFSSPVSCERRCVDFLVDSLRRSHKFWIFSGIMAERCRPLWPLCTTLPVSRNLATKRCIVSIWVHCFCQNLSCIAAVSEVLIFWQSSPR